MAAREKYAREFAGGGKPTTPAPNPTAAAPDANPKAKAKATPKEKAAPKAKAKADAAPVLPSPQPKQHAKGKGKGQGKGNKRSNSRSASPRSKKKIPCHFHFIKKACRKGKDCEYSHDQKVFDANKNTKVMVESQELREVNLQRTRPRRLMNHAGTGPRASADTETNATNVTILISSTLLRTPRHQAQRLLLHLSLNGVMMKGHTTRLHRMSSRRRSDLMSPRLASKRT